MNLRLFRTLLVAMTLGLASSASADVVPGEECQPWEHWEGAHGGECKIGCSVSPGPTRPVSAPLAVGALVVGALLVRRRS